jgi:hypothetical protein
MEANNEVKVHLQLRCLHWKREGSFPEMVVQERKVLYRKGDEWARRLLQGRKVIDVGRRSHSSAMSSMKLLDRFKEDAMDESRGGVGLLDVV